MAEKPGIDTTCLSGAEAERYSRHLVLPEIGESGQRALKCSSVLLVGTGGLGAPVGLYLAAAGVGRLGLVDFDRVDVTNLQRQILYASEDVGERKIDAAARRLSGLNPEITIETHDIRLTSGNAMELISAYDVVVDGTDNFATRYLINDACVLLGKPNVYGSIYRFEGQATVFAHDGGPCYRCLFPDPPAPDLVPNCAEGGVLGVLPGIIGSIQATEAIKLIVGKGENLAGRLLLFDALSMRFREVSVPRSDTCAVCGPRATITELQNYDEYCAPGASNDATPEMTVKALKQRRDDNHAPLLIDVREPDEHEFCNIGGTLIPMAQIPAKASELDPNRETVIYCRSGVRSAAVVRFLKEAGFKDVSNLRGGILAWADEIDPTVPRY